MTNQKKTKTDTMKVDSAQLIAAFEEWERRWRQDPAGFISDQERLASAGLTLAQQRTTYLLGLIDEQANDGS